MHQNHFIELLQAQLRLQASESIGVGAEWVVADAEELEVLQFAQVLQLLIGEFVVRQRQGIQFRQARHRGEVCDVVLRGDGNRVSVLGGSRTEFSFL